MPKAGSGLGLLSLAFRTVFVSEYARIAGATKAGDGTGGPPTLIAGTAGTEGTAGRTGRVETPLLRRGALTTVAALSAALILALSLRSFSITLRSLVLQTLSYSLPSSIVLSIDRVLAIFFVFGAPVLLLPLTLPLTTLVVLVVPFAIVIIIDSDRCGHLIILLMNTGRKAPKSENAVQPKQNIKLYVNSSGIL